MSGRRQSELRLAGLVSVDLDSAFWNRLRDFCLRWYAGNGSQCCVVAHGA